MNLAQALASERAVQVREVFDTHIASLANYSPQEQVTRLAWLSQMLSARSYEIECQASDEEAWPHENLPTELEQHAFQYP